MNIRDWQYWSAPNKVTLPARNARTAAATTTTTTISLWLCNVSVEPMEKQTSRTIYEALPTIQP
ncbi:MAG: hypothetical protein K2X93_26775 [Candidatus Obscuribacterales bacterium]|nr:hypothetical protein [Candidatus Obscuribacterales bacterium]